MAAKRWRTNKRIFMQTIKASTPCADCGQYYPYYVMQFDHKYDKQFNISEEGRDVSIERLLAEINKCDIVCANCHMIRTHSWRDNDDQTLS